MIDLVVLTIDNGVRRVTITIDETDIDGTVQLPVDGSPYLNCRVHAVTFVNNSAEPWRRTLHQQLQTVNPNTTRTINIPTGQRFPLADLDLHTGGLV